MKIMMGLDEIIHFEIIQNCKSLDSVIISGCENERLLVTKNLDNHSHNWAKIFYKLLLKPRFVILLATFVDYRIVMNSRSVWLTFTVHKHQIGAEARHKKFWKT